MEFDNLKRSHGAKMSRKPLLSSVTLILKDIKKGNKGLPAVLPVTNRISRSYLYQQRSTNVVGAEEINKILLCCMAEEIPDLMMIMWKAFASLVETSVVLLNYSVISYRRITTTIR